MFNHKTSLDELHQPNVESYNESFVEVRPRSVSSDKFHSSVNLQFPIQIAGGKYVNLSRSYFEFELELGILPKGDVGAGKLVGIGSRGNDFSAVGVDGEDAEGAAGEEGYVPAVEGVEAGDGQVGLDRAWWANTLSAVRHKINGNTICSSNDVVHSTITAMQSHTSDYNENQGSAFSYQVSDSHRRRATAYGTTFTTAMRRLNSMTCTTLIPGSISQQIELDFKQFDNYKQAIFRIVNGDEGANQLADDENPDHYDGAKLKAAFAHMGEGFSATAHDTDIVYFAITDIKLMVCTVADKMNRAIPQSMLLEWEDYDVQRVDTHSSSINSQLDIQHGHRVTMYTRAKRDENNALVSSVSPADHREANTTEASVLIGGVQYPTPAFRLNDYFDRDALRAYLLYYDTNSQFSQRTRNGEIPFDVWAEKPILSQKIAIPSEPGKQKLSTTLRVQYNTVGDDPVEPPQRTCALVSSYVKAALLSFTGGELRSVRLSTV